MKLVGLIAVAVLTSGATVLVMHQQAPVPAVDDPFHNVIQGSTPEKFISVRNGGKEVLYIGHRRDGRAELCMNGEPCIDSFADGGTEILQRWLVGTFRYACP